MLYGEVTHNEALQLTAKPLRGLVPSAVFGHSGGN
jgi:hypothetical protein